MLQFIEEFGMGVMLCAAVLGPLWMFSLVWQEVESRLKRRKDAMKRKTKTRRAGVKCARARRKSSRAHTSARIRQVENILGHRSGKTE